MPLPLGRGRGGRSLLLMKTLVPPRDVDIVGVVRGGCLR